MKQGASLPTLHVIQATLEVGRQLAVLIQRVTSPQRRKQVDAITVPTRIRQITIAGVKRLADLHQFTMQAVIFIQVRQATRRVHLMSRRIQIVVHATKQLAAQPVGLPAMPVWLSRKQYQ